MTAVMQLFIIKEIQLFKVNWFSSLIVLTKQGGGDILTHIITFINPHRHERHHIRNSLRVCNLKVGFFSSGNSTNCTLL